MPGIHNDQPPVLRMETRRAYLAKVGVLIAVGIGLGFSLFGVPNVEPLSGVAFIAGYLVGKVGGLLVGGISILLFSLFNPLGPPIPGILLAQVVAMALIGASGALWRRIVGAGVISPLVAAIFGIVGTLVYSIATDLALAGSIGRLTDPLPVLIAGLPFSLVHILSNGAIFFGIGLVLPRRYPPFHAE